MFSPIEALRRESLKGGIKRPFSIPALAAGAMVQYTRDHEDIRGVLQDYKQFNSMFITNNSEVEIAVDLDFTASKRVRVPAHMTMTEDQVQFLEFNVTNMDAAVATTAGQVLIIAINERPLAREAR
jgi:hypothetical protein